MRISPTLQALRFVLIIVGLLEASVSFQTNHISDISISAHFAFFYRIAALFSWEKKPNVLSSLHTAQCLLLVSAAKSHGHWISTAQFTALLLSTSRQGKEWNNFVSLLLAAPLQQWVRRQHYLSPCAAIFQLHALKLKFRAVHK